MRASALAIRVGALLAGATLAWLLWTLATDSRSHPRADVPSTHQEPPWAHGSGVATTADLPREWSAAQESEYQAVLARTQAGIAAAAAAAPDVLGAEGGSAAPAAAREDTLRADLERLRELAALRTPGAVPMAAAELDRWLLQYEQTSNVETRTAIHHRLLGAGLPPEEWVRAARARFAATEPDLSGADRLRLILLVRDRSPQTTALLTRLAEHARASEARALAAQSLTRDRDPSLRAFLTARAAAEADPLVQRAIAYAVATFDR